MPDTLRGPMTRAYTHNRNGPARIRTEDLSIMSRLL